MDKLDPLTWPGCSVTTGLWLTENFLCMPRKELHLLTQGGIEWNELAAFHGFFAPARACN
jgi:hypothetical protein